MLRFKLKCASHAGQENDHYNILDFSAGSIIILSVVRLNGSKDAFLLILIEIIFQELSHDNRTDIFGFWHARPH